MSNPMTPEQFHAEVESYGEDIRRASDEYAAARRNRKEFVERESAKLLGIKPGDHVIIFPTQSWPQDKMSVERIEYFGKSPSGELTFALHGLKLLRSGSVGKMKVCTSVFEMSRVHEYKL